MLYVPFELCSFLCKVHYLRIAAVGMARGESPQSALLSKRGILCV